MGIKKLDSICLFSEEPDKLADFYEEVIGLPVDKRLNLPKDKGVQFKLGDVYFFVGYHDRVRGSAKDPYRIMIGFRVKSVREIYDNLVRKGVKFILNSSPSPDATFFVSTAMEDPEGNIIQFFSNEPQDVFI